MFGTLWCTPPAAGRSRCEYRTQHVRHSVVHTAGCRTLVVPNRRMPGRTESTAYNQLLNV